MKIDTGEDDRALVELTPLIDAVFLLLIFFMVTATFQNDERDLAIKVPEAESGNPMTDLPELLVVGVRRDGELTIGGQPLQRDELRSVLVRAKRKNDRQRVIARVDGDAAFRHSIVVLDLCTALGIETSVAVAEAKGH